MVLFRISNHPEDYAKCFAVIQFIKNNVYFEFDDPVEILPIDDYSVKSGTYFDFADIYGVATRHKMFRIKNNIDLSSTIGQLNVSSKHFCFFVENFDDSDCVNFHYFDLIRFYEPNSYLLIEPNGDDDYFRISDFYSRESYIDEAGYSHRFCMQKIDKQLKAIRLEKKRRNISRYFLPLLRTNLNNHACLSKTVSEAFDKDIFLSVDVQKKYLGTINTDTTENVIKIYCLKLIIERKIDFRHCSEELVQMPLLGLCFFLSYLYVKNDSPTLFVMKSLLLQAMDFAEGVLQLIENAAIHAEENGYFCYRIHHQNAEYLRSYYRGRKKIPEFALEILVSDLNLVTDIPHKFVDNLKKPARQVEAELISQFSKTLRLSDFFEQRKEAQLLFAQYYQDKSNIALHYGLNIFDQVVRSAGGMFSVVSSTNCKINTTEKYMTSRTELCSHHIPGTQYEILLPIEEKQQQSATGIKIGIDYNQLQEVLDQSLIVFTRDAPASKMPGAIYIKLPNSADYKLLPAEKDERVRSLFNILYESMTSCTTTSLLVFDIREITSLAICEVISKAFICLLDNALCTKKFAFINASDSFVLSFIRIFGLLYYKSDNCKFLYNKEVYVCGTDQQSEIVFMGNSIVQSVSATKKLSDYKGEYSYSILLLEYIAKKCQKHGSPRKIPAMFPFDMVIRNKTSTLFQLKVHADLMRDLQEYPFGCRLSNVHMKVGSKIHVTDCFFEATLLFGIENYITRFAYLLAANISRTANKHGRTNDILLIGYETYSELLMIETQKALLHIFNIQTDFVIYEDSSEGDKFRFHAAATDFYSKDNIVIIVPIGSTLTSHDKIVADLKRQTGFVTEDNILSNQCVVLIRDSLDNTNGNTRKSVVESQYWENITDTFVQMKTDYHVGSRNQIDYIVCVNDTWETQEKCRSCYPEDDLLKEKPILAVNKTSVVPMIMIGLAEENPLVPPHMSVLDTMEGDVSWLKDTLRYGHFSRSDNHYEYFFETEKIMTGIVTDREKFERFNIWLNSIKERMIVGQKKMKDEAFFDFIVAPQHSTNAEFVVNVNEKVFSNPASILWIDVKREYRDNIKTKYSNITQLFNNLVNYGRSATISFHFVDDTITTGGHFYRAQSLIRSLFCAEAFTHIGYNNVKIRLFDSVIVLLGRLSGDTKLNYASKGDYYSFFNLDISSLRNHKDACVLCKKHDAYLEMRRTSATNLLADEFSLRVNKYKIHDFQASSPTLRQKDYYRMIFTHEINNELGKVGSNKNDEMVVLEILQNEFIKAIELDRNPTNQIIESDIVCSFLHVVSAPFLVFRKSALSASFSFFLQTITSVLYPHERKNTTDYEDTVCKYILHLEKLAHDGSKEPLKHFVEYLFYRLSHLGANFLLRTDVINSFFSYVREHFYNADDKTGNEKNVWIKFYCVAAKQTLHSNKQDSRGLWLEHILTKYKELTTEKNLNTACVEVSLFRDIAFLENNVIIADALKESIRAIQEVLGNDAISETMSTKRAVEILIDNGEDTNENTRRLEKIANTLNSYYCVSYRSMVLDASASLLQANSPIAQEMLAMTIFSLLLIPNSSSKGSKDLQFSRVLLLQVKKILKANRVNLFMSRDEVVEFIESTDDIYDDDSYQRFAAHIKDRKLEGIKTIGDTVFLGYELSAIRIVKIDSEHEDLTTEKIPTEWYLVYKPTSRRDELHDERNLLVMRDILLHRLQKDLDNNLYEEFAILKNKIKKLLPNEKAGGHTPFAELSIDFEKLRVVNIDNVEIRRQAANQIKLLTDQLISKLYVCHINDDKYPSQITNMKDDVNPKSLRNYRDIIELADGITITTGASKRTKACIDFAGVNWDLELEFMDKAEFVWVVFFHALVLNALRHGLPKLLNSNSHDLYVKITVKTENDFLVIGNSFIPREHNSVDGITLETIKSFFKTFGFDFSVPKPHVGSDVLQYCMKLPLKKRRPTDGHQENPTH